MKILLITQLPPPNGGIATWSKAYIDYFFRKEVTVSCVNCALTGVRAKNYNAKRRLFDEIRRTVGIVQQVIQQKKKDFDIIHLNTTGSALGIIRDWLCVLLLHRKAPMILHCHCSVNDKVGGNRIGMFFFKSIIHKVSTTLVLNEQSYAWVYGRLGYKPIILPNFLAEDMIVSNEERKFDGVKNVFYSGHLLESKGILEIATIAKENKDINFVLAGAYKEDIRDRLFMQNVTLLGDVSHDQVLQQLDRADLFLFLSHSEGFSLSLLEAMARGVPALVTDVGANKDMIEDSGGIVVQPQDIENIAAGFDMMCKKSPESLKEMSDWEIGKVQRQYTTNAVMTYLEEIYHQEMRKARKTAHT